MVDITKVNSSIKVDCVYATDNNFTGKVIYKESKCYALKEVAQKLDLIQKELEKRGLGLLIWDAFRPLPAQKKLWEICPDEKYVSNPAKGGRHTRGTAIDLTLVDSKGNLLEMPTGFDDLSKKAWSDNNECSFEAKKNRALLKEVMEKHGFKQLPTEWWHFDYNGWQDYPVLDVDFDALN